MKGVAKGMSILSLILLVVAPGIYFTGAIELPAVKLLLNTATVIWFISTPVWMGREPTRNSVETDVSKQEG